jgi:hypothetical protein
MNQSSFKYLVILILILVSTQITFTQEIIHSEGSPEWLVQMFFNSAEFPDKEKYFTGEMENEINFPTIGEEINGQGEISFSSFYSDEQKNAFAVNLKVNSTELDFYCYLFKSPNGWKIEAVRRFLFPKFIYIATDSLSTLISLSSADSSLLKLLNLMTSGDEELKKYLVNNIDKFERLLQYFDEDNQEMIEIMIDELSLNGIFKDEAHPGCIFVQIAAIESQEIGFIFKQNGSVLPKVSPHNFIYVGEVMPGWYLYRLI